MATALFPNTVVTRTQLPSPGDLIEVATTLTADVSPGATPPFTLSLADTSEFPSAGYVVVGVEDFREVMRYDSKTATDVNVVQRDTTGQGNLTHTSGDDAFIGPVALYTDQRSAEIIAVETELGTDPSGTYSTVKDRLDAIDTAVGDPLTRNSFVATVSVTTPFISSASGDLEVGSRLEPNTDNVHNLGRASKRWADVYSNNLFGTRIYLGSNTATSGIIRIPNNQVIVARNAANTGNVLLLSANVSDQAQVETDLRVLGAVIANTTGSFNTSVTTPLVQNTSGPLELRANTGTSLGLGQVSSVKWNVQGNGYLVPNVDALYDIGTSTTVVRNVYAESYFSERPGVGVLAEFGLTSSGFVTNLPAGGYKTRWQDQGVDKLILENTSANWALTAGSNNDQDLGVFNSVEWRDLYLARDAYARGRFRAGDGTAAIPSFGFISATGPGFFKPANNQLGVSTNATECWRWDASGHYRPATTNTFDLGTSSVRVRTGYFGTSVQVGTNPSASGAIRLPGAVTGSSNLSWADSAGTGWLSLGPEGTDGLSFGRGSAWPSEVRVNNNVIAKSGVLEIGTNPATTGAVRLASTQYIYNRNAANTANLLVAGFNSSDRLLIGNSGNQIRFQDNIYPNADGALTVGSTSIRWAAGYFSESVRIGTNPSSSGTVRLANDSPIKARNAANTGDLTLISANSADQILLGDPNAFDIAALNAISIRQSGSGFTASAGALRMVNGEQITWRNGSNSGNIVGLEVTSSDHLFLGGTSALAELRIGATSGNTPVTLQGSVKTTTGDFGTPRSGMVQINEVDNTIKIYADGAWRTIASW